MRLQKSMALINRPFFITIHKLLLAMIDKKHQTVSRRHLPPNFLKNFLKKA